ncbi:MAG: FISUMP domain-containing protein [Bacteroidales bacterium]|nr:FISUMP domain-containing protein [Bacteroidales bacterium]
MKKIFLIIYLSISFSSLLSPLSFLLSAQVPHSFSYQAVVRGSNGDPVAYQNTSFRISLLLGSDTGPVSYQETHLQTTNFFGLVNLEIGNGTAVSGIMDTLSWGSKSYYIKIEADTAGGSNFVALGTTQLLAVPYALHAEDAAASSGIRDRDGDTKIEAEENPDEDIIRFYTGGQEQLRIMDKRLEILNPDRNIFVGESSGENNTGVDNVFLGHLAGKNNTTGGENVFIGDSSGTANAEGTNNTFVGAWSGTGNTTGVCNAFFGTDAGERNQTGTRNAFLGYGAGYRSIGSRNTFVGSHAGMYNTAGDYNTFVGQAAGMNSSGSSNVFIGRTAGQYEGGSNKLYIANSSTGEPLIYGEFDNQLLRFHAMRIEIRNQRENTIVGDNAGFATHGSRNVYLGTRAVVLESNGSSNVMIGYEAGAHNTTGNWDVMVGYQAGSANTTGNYNVFLGWNTGNSNTTGHRNTFIGPNAGSRNTTGIRNVFVGLSAGNLNTSGSFNTYVGRAAGMNNTEGNDNVFLGDMAGANEMGSNKLYIANSETPEPLIYGDFIEKRVKLWADTLEVEGVTSTGEKFSVGGDPGLSDTLFAITSFDFANQKIKFRKQVIKGGITIELTGESEWMDSISRRYVFCDPLTDSRDGKQYLTVRIGDQCWMAENLNVGIRIDGTIEQSDNGTIEKYCYNDEDTNCTAYGGLYSWSEVMQHSTYPGSQGICPKGWHVPSDEEYKILEGTVDSLYAVGDPQWDLTGWRGSNAGKRLRSTAGWAGGGNGTDTFGFHALPGGYRAEEDGFNGGDSSAYFWAFSSIGSESSYSRHLGSGSPQIGRNTLAAGNGLSLRCIKGPGTDPPMITTKNLTNITGSTATSGGTITGDGGDPVTARGVVWSTNENPTLSDNFTADGTGTGEFTSNLTGLANATHYYVRAYATNSTGTRYGNQFAFTTPGASCPGGATVVWQGKTYHTVMIGSQCWLKENLNVGTMINITEQQSDNGTIEKYCYDNDTANCTLYGGLYVWNEMMQYVSQQGAQALCPTGWHIASDDEWKVLLGTVDSQYGVGDAIWENRGSMGFDAGNSLKSISGWNENGSGTDAYGFSSLPGGFCWSQNGFGYINQCSAYWTSSEIVGTDKAWDTGLNYQHDQVDRTDDIKGDFGQSVRCLNNQTSLPMVTTAAITDITQNSAVSGGNATSIGGSAVTARGVCWGTSEFPTLYDDHSTDGAGAGDFTSNLTGLNANTQYYVRAYATNGMGTAYGSSIRFITQGQPCPGVPTVTWEGQTYQTVQIGNQCWLEENMNAGTMIEGTMEQSNNGTIEKYCYNDDPSNCTLYGGLYQWQEAMQYSTDEGAQGICPDGWHIPTDAEIKILEGTADTHYGVGDPEWEKISCRGYDAGIHLKSLSGWPQECNGDNLSGFNYLYSQGYRNTDGTFISPEYWAGSPLWSSSQYNGNNSWPRKFPCQMGGLCRDYDDTRYGWSVRCIKN